ncbi:hypothetical protein MHBO_000032 [Bonamia ostreae]|uniref:Uncharacterized protein n=1 Tax=Bonamia ostreae TaxID=126728 RepID=A0ABV2AE45_9EUKA
MAIFNRLIEKNKKYYNSFQSCINGEDPLKQHDLLVSSIQFTISNLKNWEVLKQKLIQTGSRHEEWMPGLKIDIFEDFITSFHKAMIKLFPNYGENGVLENFTILLRLVMRVMEEQY